MERSPIWPVAVPIPDMESGLLRAYMQNLFSYCDNETGRVIVVPAGFRTDYTSIPWPVSILYPRQGEEYDNAAFVHDYLYALGLPGERHFADRVMLAAMKDYEVDWLTRHVIYLGVRFGGAHGYGKKSDWVFVNPDFSRLENEPKPDRAYKLILPDCVGYAEMVISGELFDGPAAPFGDPTPPSDSAPDDGPDQP